ncbi:MAG: hypothetical protein FWH23_01910 [Bacteroidales bacterium]|nr:hypothetical protein [Bacteroidales bacterium]
MMNTKIDIEGLLKQLPIEKTDSNFTAQLISSIASLPAPQPKQLSKPIIICACIGLIGLMVGAWLISDYFFGWTELYVQPLLSNIVASFKGILPRISQIECPPIIIEGLLVGAVLLVIDAVVRHKVVTGKPL